MADGTKIEWTDWTWNPVRGCSRVSPGCENCYAERQARRFDRPGAWAHGLTVMRGGRPGWSGKVVLVPEILDEPLRKRTPRRVFVCSGADLFHEKVPFEYLASVHAVMAAASQHTFQVLTKHPERAVEFQEHVRRLAEGRTTPLTACVYEAQKICPHEKLRRVEDYWTWPIPNVGVGVSVEDQARADQRIPVLRQIEAAWRFLSCEPLLERVELDLEGIDWVIVGGESGPLARPCALEWIFEIVEACRAANVPCFVKQLGAVCVSEERAADTVEEAREMLGPNKNDRWLWCAGFADPAGRDPGEWPEELCVRMHVGDAYKPVEPPPRVKRIKSGKRTKRILTRSVRPLQ